MSQLRFSNSRELAGDHIIFYEIWIYQLVDLKIYKKVVTITENGIQLTPLLDWSEYVGPHNDVYPITKIELEPVPESCPRSLLSSWDTLDNKLNDIIEKVFSKISAQKEIFALNDSNFLNPESGREYIPVNDINSPLAALVEPGKVNNDEWNVVGVIQNLIQQVSGQGQNRRGSAGIRTATEASIIERSSQAREGNLVSYVSKLIQDDMYILVNMIKSFMKKQFVFRLTGKTGSVKWQAFDPNIADHDMFIVVDDKSFNFNDTTEKIQKLQMAIQAGSNINLMMGGGVNIVYLYRQMLSTLGIKNVEEIAGRNDTSAVKQMTEIILMIVGMDAPVDISDDHQAELKTIVQFMSSEVFSALPPATLEKIAMHASQHEEMLKELQAQSTRRPDTGNSFDDIYLKSNGSSASNARQDTQDLRETF
jgi:hypothetical protein